MTDPSKLIEQAMRSSAQGEITTESVVKVTPKCRFVANVGNTLVIIPDLRNPVDEEGFKLNPGEKVDLLLYFTPQEINRSRGLDNLIQGVTNPQTGEVVTPPVLKVLKSLDEEIPEIPPPFIKTQRPGAQLEAEPNYADENLQRLEEQEQKEFERIRTQNRHMSKR